MQSNRSFKIGIATFLITLCVLGVVGGLIAVNEVSHDLSKGEKREAVGQTQAVKGQALSYLPPQCQAFLLIPKWQTKWWDYYFTVLKAP